MKKQLIALTAIALMGFCSCEKMDGDPITQEFSIEGSYTALDVDDAFDVSVSDEVTQVVVTAGDNIMSKVRVERVGNTLKLYLKGWTISHGSMKVVLPYNPILKSVDLSGASEFRSAFPLTSQKVEVECSGASDFYGSVAADELELDISGSSNATIDGVVVKLDMSISGSSDLKEKIVGNRYSLACSQCECSVSGSSDAFIHCDTSIKGSVSGSSSLHYTGNAATTNCSVSGSSSIVHDVL